MQTKFKIQVPPQLRVVYFPPTPSIKITGTQQAEAFFREIWDDELISVQEQFYVLFLNRPGNLIGWRCLGTGTIGQCLVDVKLLFGMACSCLASSIIVAHNHPSGSLEPSIGDKVLTTQMLGAGKVLDIHVHDHLIMTRDGSHSVIGY